MVLPSAAFLLLLNRMIHGLSIRVDAAIFSNYKSGAKLRCICQVNERLSEVKLNEFRVLASQVRPKTLRPLIKRNEASYLLTLSVVLIRATGTRIIGGLESLSRGINLSSFLATRAVIT
jgi:hypothetical protein